ncbi:hypothetical protein, partial [Citricoccus zhacaiensis]|uniref:hypothetical protein n=1 Tax=Citricoccus zhacaiensis TaxID=489142 RepID=UPI003CF1CF93
GGAADSHSTNQIIGINKLGTLLSSQTTGTSQVLTKKPGNQETRKPRNIFAFLICGFSSFGHSLFIVKSAFSAFSPSQKR